MRNLVPIGREQVCLASYPRHYEVRVGRYDVYVGSLHLAVFVRRLERDVHSLAIPPIARNVLALAEEIESYFEGEVHKS